ncbi:hypothetical protein ACPOL_1583 [Acidisarcina polymorpha]|uniref:Tat (Twin-arginine translocation) pathway signal sequence domain protein n=1 Tax=Acidisarcina polymorpha TaxID=2211140 RepID=A0A2Z5FVK9_9BACT|nr:DUF1501 domain-containing protein [Acidisarcina polymorpha]AXC10929.1 hypothetical protein ACPOL_1583 [Acidisarcina polymorpha]
MSFNRRSFIRYASLAAAGHVAGLRPFGAMNGLAESAADYKALVCIFFYGGNDSNNLLVPFDSSNSDVTGYANYARIRGPLALPKSSLLQLGPDPSYALHPSLPQIRSLFNSGNVALIANVGTLIQPLSRAQYMEGQGQTPTNLFSHPDQQQEWQNATQTATSPTGWAGRIADKLTSTYNPGSQIPLVTSAFGDSIFCNGATTSPVAVQPGNVQGGACSEGAACAGRLATAQHLLSFSSGLSLVQADNQITGDAYKYMNILGDAVRSVAPLQTDFPANNGLAAQLRQIAQIIQVRQALGVRRQIFFAGLGNFDTHANQLGIQSGLLSLVGPAMSAFYEATKELGVADSVTSFTMSDFSRALQPNSNDGSDHAWGGHHMIMGGAVKGGRIYGTYPTLALNGPSDIDGNGRWLPTTASTQYAATLASWFGVPAADMPVIFPSINSFATKHLGFV